MINITIEKLEKILLEAYLAGWHGSLELKDNTISNLLSQAREASSNYPQSLYINSQPHTSLDVRQLTLANFGEGNNTVQTTPYTVNEGQGTITINTGGF